jgi:hypothetical protein
MIKDLFAITAMLVALAISSSIAHADDDGGGDSDSHGGSDSSSSSGSSGGGTGGGSADSGGNPYAAEIDFLRFFHPPYLLPKVAAPPTAGRVIGPDEEGLFMARGWDASPLRDTRLSPAAQVALRPQKNVTAAATTPTDALLTLRYPRFYPETNDDIAVIIGNVNYQNSGIPNNEPAARDAAAFEIFAKKALGINEKNIIRMTDATQASFLRIFGSQQTAKGQLADWVKPTKSRVYVYYSGHGAPAPADDSFLIPVDADSARLELNGYPLSTLYRNLSQLQAKQVWLVLESCFSGVAQNGAIVTNASPIFARQTVIEPPNNVSVFSAAKVDQIASWEPDQSHGLFTKHFLQGMSGHADVAPFGNQDGVVNHVELNAYLRENLSYWARRYHGRDQVALIQNWSQP